MANTGSLGGLGGMAAPSSQVVQYQQNPYDWLKSQQTAYTDFMSRGTPNRGSYQTSDGMKFDISTQADAYQKELNDQMARAGAQTALNTSLATLPTASSPGSSTNGVVQRYTSTLDPGLAAKIAGSNYTAGSVTQVPGVGLKAPDPAPFMAEFQAMLPGFENATRLQQAYSNQTGNGQLNGIMTDAYKQPNFGVVDGYFGADKLGPNQNPVDMEWAGDSAPATTSGTYSPDRKLSSAGSYTAGPKPWWLA